MVELGSGGGSNPTPPTQTHIPTDPTLPNPIYTPSPTPSPKPTLPFPTLPNPTPRQATPPHPQTISTFALPCSARHWVKHGMDWNSIMSSLKEHSLFIYNLPPTINPTDHLTPTPQTLTLIPLTMTPPPDIGPLTLTPRL